MEETLCLFSMDLYVCSQWIYHEANCLYSLVGHQFEFHIGISGTITDGHFKGIPYRCSSLEQNVCCDLDAYL